VAGRRVVEGWKLGNAGRREDEQGLLTTELIIL
jgi:hypothetical protein